MKFWWGDATVERVVDMILAVRDVCLSGQREMGLAKITSGSSGPWGYEWSAFGILDSDILSYDTGAVYCVFSLCPLRYLIHT